MRFIVKGENMLSFVIATFNSENYILRCLESFATQTYRDFELVIVDGSSQDKTVEICKCYSDRLRMKIISEPDEGIYDAWNKGINICSGEWIAFLGSDDQLQSHEALHTMSQIINGLDAKISILYGRVTLCEHGVAVRTMGRDWFLQKPRLMLGEMIPHPGSLHRKTVFSEFGVFDQNFKICGDLDLTLRILKNTEAHFAGDLDYILMDSQGISNSLASFDQSYKESRDAYKNNGISFTPFLYLYYFKKSVFSLVKKIFGDGFSKTFRNKFRNIIYKSKL